jgi:hypothetical protein
VIFPHGACTTPLFPSEGFSANGVAELIVEFDFFRKEGRLRGDEDGQRRDRISVDLRGNGAFPVSGGVLILKKGE